MTRAAVSRRRLALARALFGAVLGVALATSGAPAAANEQGFIGMEVQGLTPEIVAALGLTQNKGVLVRDLAADGAAARAGIRQGDLLVRFGDVEVDNRETLLKAAAGIKANQKLTAAVVRRGKTIEVNLAPMEWPAGRKIDKDSVVTVPEIGLTLAALTPKMRERFQVRWGSVGVLVTLVDPAKSRSDIQRGEIIVQINQEDLSQPQQVADRIKEAKAKGKNTVLLLVESATGFRYIAHKLP